MEKENPYERMDYYINNNRFLINSINKPKNWIFENYIGNNNIRQFNTSKNVYKNEKNINEFNNTNGFQNNINIIQNERNKNEDIKESLIDININGKEFQKIKEKEKYRKDLLNQIEDNERRKKEMKRKIEEENKLNELKNKEYLIYKQKQEEDFEKFKKMNNNKKLKSQFDINNQEFNISYYNKKEENKEEKKEINNKKSEKEIKKEKRIERKKEEITNNYNRIIRSNYFNMFQEKEELNNYINKEFQDFLYILDDEFENEKNIDFYKNRNLDNNLRLPYGNSNDRIQRKGIRYIYSNNHKNLDKSYNMIFEKIDGIKDLTKSYKKEINPSIYFNHKIDILLDSFSNMIIQNNNRENNYMNNKIKKLSGDIKNYETKEKIKLINTKEKDYLDNKNEKIIEESNDLPKKNIETKGLKEEDLMTNKINKKENTQNENKMKNIDEKKGKLISEKKIEEENKDEYKDEEEEEEDD